MLMYLPIRQAASSTDGLDPNANIGGSALGIIWTLVTLAMVVVAARVYTQARVTRQFGLSDGLVIVSVTILIGWASLITVQYHYGWGRHQEFVPIDELQESLKYNITGQSFGIMGSTFGRLSFIVLMLNLFGTTNRMRYTLWGLFIAQCCTNLTVVITCYAQCKDPRALYDFSVPQNCWPADIQTYLGYAHTAFNGVTDLFLTALPATMLWSLNMKTRLKIGLAFLLGLSLLAFVGVIMKIVYLNALSNRGDFTWTTVSMFTWVTVEGTLVDIAASVPLLRPLIRKRGAGGTTNPKSYEMPRYGTYGSKSGPGGSIITGPFSKLGDSKNPLSSGNDTGSEEVILPFHASATDAAEKGAAAVGVAVGEPGIHVHQTYSVQYNGEQTANLRNEKTPWTNSMNKGR